MTTIYLGFNVFMVDAFYSGTLSRYIIATRLCIWHYWWFKIIGTIKHMKIMNPDIWTFLLKLIAAVSNRLYFLVDHWSSFTRMQDIHTFHNHINIIFDLCMSVFLTWFKHEQVGQPDITLRRLHWLHHRRTRRGFSLRMYAESLVVG